MNRRSIAGAILAIWFILNGIDFLQDADLIEYSSTEMDKTVEDVLDNFEEAVRSGDDTQIAAVNPIFFHEYSFYVDYTENFAAQSDPAQRLEKEAKFLLGNFKPHKLHQTFLI